VSESNLSDPKSPARNDFVSMEERDEASSSEHDFRRMPVVIKGNSVE
jgi:hypothetical protein